jgi:HD-GYP domain-containing protein (c-di-GMP phosphodiesterase class II)
LGGDEFALLLTGRDRAGMVAFLESLRAAVAAEPYLPAHDGPPVPLGLTHGLAVFPGDGAETGVATLALADSRLLAAKRSGQARWSAELRDELTGSLYGFVLLDNLVTSLDARDRYTRRHMEEAAYHALLIADALNLPDTDRRTLEVAGLVYDIGKIGIPDDILRLPRALSPEELAVARVHPVLGASLVGSLLDRPDVPPVVRHHHENWDGSGYPDGLAGEEIPLLARVLAVADAYTALLSDRPHRRAFSRAAAREIIRAGAGTRFCPACAAALM